MTHDHSDEHEHSHEQDHDHTHEHEHGHPHEHGHDHDHDHEHTHMHLSPDEALVEFRTAKDDFIRTDPQSPLPEGARTTFTGLNYYPLDDALRFELPLDTNVPHEHITMDVTTGGSREFHRAGKIHFNIAGQPAELSIYESDGTLFLPLRDATSKAETYRAGRYLEPELIDDGTVLVDFNYLYNPFCAYDDRWSCPVPPTENWLQVPLAAGEKRYHP